MTIINTNRLRLSVRTFRRDYGEWFRDFTLGRYISADHGKLRRETNLYLTAFGIVAHLKWRPDGKRT